MKEGNHQFGNLRVVAFKREMSAGYEMDFGIRHVALEGLYRFGCPHTCSCLVMMNESSMDIARTPKITIRLMEVGTSI